MMDVTILLSKYTILYNNAIIVAGIQSFARRYIATIYTTTPIHAISRGGELEILYKCYV